MTDIAEYIANIKKASKENKHIEPKYNCENCKDSKEIVIKQDGIYISRPCECTVKGNALKHLRFSGLSEDNIKLGWINFKCETKEQELCRSIAQDYVRKFKGIEKAIDNGMLLTGKSGRGKTMLSLITMNYLLADGIDIYYMSYRGTIAQMKQDRVDSPEDYKTRLDLLKNCQVLIIDDLFKGKISEADFNIMFEIIDYRLSARKPIIISTELSMDELLKIDVALAGRINQMCKNHTATFSDKIKNHRL